MTTPWTEAADIAAQQADHDRAQNDERWTDRNAAWREIYDDRQPSTCELADGFDAPDARERPDPWAPCTCQRCGQVHTAGMPEKCEGCGMRCYGVAS